MPGTLIVLVVLIEIGTVSYTSSFKGAQEDIVAMYQAGSGISSENDTAVMLKLLISA